MDEIQVGQLVGPMIYGEQFIHLGGGIDAIIICSLVRSRFLGRAN